MGRGLKLGLGVVVLLGIVATGSVLYGIYVGNPKVVEEIVNHPDGERAGQVMLLTFDDGRSLPVNYLREGDRVFVGADGPWWRSFRAPGAMVSMVIRGEQLTGRAVVELDDQAFVDDVFSRLRPAAPSWLPDWLNGKLVVITVGSE